MTGEIPLGSLVAELAGLTRRAHVQNCLYLLEGTSHCATHYGKNLALFHVNKKENLKINQTLPRT